MNFSLYDLMNFLYRDCNWKYGISILIFLGVSEAQKLFITVTYVLVTSPCVARPPQFPSISMTNSGNSIQSECSCLCKFSATFDCLNRILGILLFHYRYPI